MVDPYSKGLQTISDTLAVEIEEKVLSNDSAQHFGSMLGSAKANVGSIGIPGDRRVCNLS